MSYNSGVIVLVISIRSRAMRSADLKLVARLLPELYSTQSSYQYEYMERAYGNKLLFIMW